MITALLLVSSLAFANPAAQSMTIPMPALGVSIVINDCKATIVGKTSAAKAGRLAREAAAAETECLEARAAAEEHAHSEERALIYANNSGPLYEGAVIVAFTGENVSLKDPNGLEFDAGPWLKTKAVAEAMASANPIASHGAIGGVDARTAGLMRAMGVAPGYQVGGSSQQMAMVLGSELGSAPVAAPTAPCGTAAQCQKAIDKLQDELSVADD